ncbi:RCC1 domain-containing protein, partial [Chitinimonas sp.]|uniref:RCC1 domain-containing protein n=1 Tax=Chitinimonas sp. TaxID=1934313 RepID=UPI0035B0FF3F
MYRGKIVGLCIHAVLLSVSAGAAPPAIATSSAGSSYAVDANGQLWSWGDDSSGQLGLGRTLYASRPQPVSGGWGRTPLPQGVLAAGGDHALALLPDGRALAWGANTLGQLGDGSKSNSRSSPVLLSGVYAQLAAGYNHSLAIDREGGLWAWGVNWAGQIGDGSFEHRYQATRIGGDYAMAAGGDSHSLGLKRDGSLWAWGSNQYGQLGSGGTTGEQSGSPTAVLVGSGFSRIAAGLNHNLALKPDGSLWAWGNNEYGQVGDGSGATFVSKPVQIGSGFKAISAGNHQSLGIKLDGSLWGWGDLDYGLGNGQLTLRPTLLGTGYQAAV